ncbi:MAG: amidase [Cyclobacteriaceae bacterium]|nr:amidase [Cyclobacteriaceae bacterium HetDA_MAG_MS6]
MKRRSFIKNTALGSAAVSAMATSCTPSSSNWTEEYSGGPVRDDFELMEITVKELQQKMQEGTYTSKTITQLYLDRIEKIDKAGPKLNSVIEINPDALAIAEQMDQERAQGKVRGPLHGIPVMIKDNIDTADKMLTTAGSLALSGNIARKDAFIVEQLRKAGAVLLGKTNLSEWANFRSTRSSSGWSSRGGQTRNPYILDRNPCGSSSGSGAAVSANLCALTIGTETNGSIVCPSSTNGVVGIKPTVGLVSRSGVIPISHSQDTTGPMARCVEDAAIFLSAIAGVDEKDAITRQSLDKVSKDYTQFLDSSGLEGARIGIGRSFMGFHEEVDVLMEEAFEVFRSRGAELIELDEVIPDISSYYGKGYNVLQYEFRDGLNRYLAGANPDTGIKTLADVIEYNQTNKSSAMPYFKQEILESSQEKGDLNEEEYLEALEKVQKGARESIDEVMKENNLDAIIAPTGGPAWCIDVVNGDNFGGSSSSPAAWSGYPNITVPAGFVYGLPVGLSIFGGAYTEPTLLKIAYGFEQATRHRKAPGFQLTLAI